MGTEEGDSKSSSIQTFNAPRYVGTVSENRRRYASEKIDGKPFCPPMEIPVVNNDMALFEMARGINKKTYRSGTSTLTLVKRQEESEDAFNQRKHDYERGIFHS